jgi:hypothetical protein
MAAEANRLSFDSRLKFQIDEPPPCTAFAKTDRNFDDEAVGPLTARRE